MTDRLRIRGGAVYDPANGLDGDVRDICIADGRIVDALPPDAPVLPAEGLVVMPGAVDIHTHVAGTACDHGRLLTAEARGADPAPAPPALRRARGGAGRSGTGGPVPSTFTTGYRYARLGYTTVFDAAVEPILARRAHAQLDDTPIVDAGMYLLMGNDDLYLRLLESGDADACRDYAAWLLHAAGGYAIKIVNPGGHRCRGGLDEAVEGFDVTPRRILESLAAAGNVLGLPHPIHVHANDLGRPSNVDTTLASMETVSGRRAHFAHLQFHAYGPGWSSAARRVAEYLDGHPELSADVGQVMFGPAMALTADGPLLDRLRATRGPGLRSDFDPGAGCGALPIRYAESSPVSALQWVVGLELLLLARDPWRLVLSTDHPNGGGFQAYPDLIRLLMDRAFRDEMLQRLDPDLLAGSALADGLSREYGLGEIAIVTRAGPARLLGLSAKGHLGPGADADVAIYEPLADRAAMFAAPRHVLKAGTTIVRDGEIVRSASGRRLHVRPAYDSGVLGHIERHFSQHATIAFRSAVMPPLRDPPQEA